MPGNLSRQGRPVGPFIFRAYVAKKFFVMRDWIFVSILLTLKTHVIRVSVQQGHAATLDNPVKFALPDIYVPLAEDAKQSEILHQRVRKLHIASAVRARHPEWKDGAHTIRLRFKGIG